MIEKLCAVVELQSEIIRVQHDVIHQLGGYDPTEEQTAQADGMSRELCGDIFDVWRKGLNGMNENESMELTEEMEQELCDGKGGDDDE